MQYNKLVRDRIPEIIRTKGQVAKTRILDEAEYKKELAKKLREEVEECLAELSEEELADVLEVVQALARVAGSTPERIERLRVQKAEERGGFAERIFLIEVPD